MESSVTKWVGFKYERLGDFCYYCGRMGHIDKDCMEKDNCDDESPMVFHYGPFLFASPYRPKISASDREKEKKWVENLSSKGRISKSEYNDPSDIRLGPPGVARKLLFLSPDACNAATPKARAISLVAVVDKEGDKLVLRPRALTEQNTNKAVNDSLVPGPKTSSSIKNLGTSDRQDGAADMDTSESGVLENASKKRSVGVVFVDNQYAPANISKKNVKTSASGVSSFVSISKVEGLGMPKPSKNNENIKLELSRD
uniref:CCHC-type domain-containing protein n=1 Tax=Chenopodium quinoa TaxID=63459 RepID=A0A803MX06_CHEQI